MLNMYMHIFFPLLFDFKGRIKFSKAKNNLIMLKNTLFELF